MGSLTRYRAHIGEGGRAGKRERKVGQVRQQHEHHPVRRHEQRPFSMKAPSVGRAMRCAMCRIGGVQMCQRSQRVGRVGRKRWVRFDHD